MAEVEVAQPESGWKGRALRGAGGQVDKLLPPPLPPPLKRKTTRDIENQINEGLSSTYKKRLNEENEIFASQNGLKNRHHYFLNPPENADLDALHMKEIMKELRKTLPHQLEVNARGSMFVRFDEDSPQYIRAVLTGVEGTPYSSGVFIFDVFLPADYPRVPCLCTHVTPNANLVHANNGPGGFSPNMHSDSGQVCLSLLGTWDGPGWVSGVSNVYQVLSTILYMILGAQHPYYMEPDYGGWEGTAPEDINDDPEKELVVAYDEEVKLFNAKLCILAPLQSPPEGFESLVRTHLFEKRKIILATLRRWASKGSPGFSSQLTGVITEIEHAYKERITRRYAEDDCAECEQVIRFIEEKMLFLTKKLQGCSSSCTCSRYSAPSPSPALCASCSTEAGQRMPKAHERFLLGPQVLARARKALVRAQLVVTGCVA